MRRIFLILGIVLGLLVAIGTFLFIQAQRPQEVTVPIANEDIAAGTVLRRELFSGVKMANVPASTYQKWVLATEFATQAEGRTATSDIKAGFPIAKASLDPNSEGGIETRLSLAITGTNDYYVVIPATPDQVGNFVQPGDRVDLIISIGDANRQEGLTIPLTPTLSADENGGITVTTPFPYLKVGDAEYEGDSGRARSSSAAEPATAAGGTGGKSANPSGSARYQAVVCESRPRPA